MCLIALALDAHPRFGLVIAANRDEYFQRPADALDWWRERASSPWLLGGRDRDAGGTWMALSEHGRVAMLTNVRDPARHRAGAASRGAMPVHWLHSDQPEHDAWPAMATRGCNPFNLIGGDLTTGRWWWADDRAAAPRPLAAGVHAVSNASLGTPWPKVQHLRRSLAAALDSHAPTDDLAARLFYALADRTAAADADLPDTGVGIDRERMLSPAFITSPDGHYGTRCSTVLIGERLASGWRLQVTERSFDASSRVVQTRQVDLHLTLPVNGTGFSAIGEGLPAVQVLPPA
jgi:uncharacterized protein with NRDE domain